MESLFQPQLQTTKNMKISKKLRKKMAALPDGAVRDTTGNLISLKYSDGSWIKWKHDADGNTVSCKWSDGSWNKYKRDANGNPVLVKWSNGYWVKYERDANGKLLSYTTSND